MRRDRTGEVRKHETFIASGARKVLRIRLVIPALYAVYIVRNMPEFVHHRALLRK
jgi:hypothetical protein